MRHLSGWLGDLHRSSVTSVAKKGTGCVPAPQSPDYPLLASCHIIPAMQPVTVSIKRRAECRDLPLPTYETEGSVGMDLAAAVDDDEVLGPGERALIPCGFFMALPPGYEAQVRPRSGLAVKHGVSLVNTPGTIDSDYRGEVKVPMINHGAEPFTVKRGMRIAQMIVMPVPPVALVEVDELPETARGEGGFGHTGE